MYVRCEEEGGVVSYEGSLRGRVGANWKWSNCWEEINAHDDAYASRKKGFMHMHVEPYANEVEVDEWWCWCLLHIHPPSSHLPPTIWFSSAVENIPCPTVALYIIMLQDKQQLDIVFVSVDRVNDYICDMVWEFSGLQSMPWTNYNNTSKRNSSIHDSRSLNILYSAMVCHVDISRYFFKRSVAMMMKGVSVSEGF